MIRKIPTHLVVLGLLFCSVDFLVAQATSHVRVEVFSLAVSVSAGPIHISGEGHSFDVMQGKTFELSYGMYTVEVSSPGFPRAKLSVVIDQPNQVVPVGLRLGAIEADEPETIPCFIYGKITPPSAVDWIKAVELFGSYRAEVTLDRDGQYEIRNLVCGGYYMLMVMGHGKLLKTQVVWPERAARHTDIDLTGNAASVSPRLN